MAEWLDSVAGPGYTLALFWTFGALLLLVVLLLAVKLVRSMTFGTFVAGGRNRKTRLAVMDATAVDSHRRLILVRRDDIEHLLLIGGPTDVVVERDIKLSQMRRSLPPAEAGREALPAATPPAAQPSPRPASAEAPRPRERPPLRPVAERPQPAPPRQPEPAVAPRVPLRTELPRSASPAPRTESRPLPPLPPLTPFNPGARPTTNTDFDDDELLKELEVSLEESAEKPAKRAGAPSLDDEMTKLLGELSTPRR